MSKMIFAIFSDEEVVLHQIPSLKSHGVRIKDVFSPFPIHGLDKALGLKRTRISICSFLYGMTGLSLAILMIWYMNISDWPMNIGGKPNYFFYKNVPAFVPVLFESTVLCAAHGMVITFYLRSKLIPGVTAFVPDVRMTDDKIVMQVEVKDASKEAEITAMLMKAGAEEVKEYGK
ncbi:MAG: DUF3341 domain-containing protein [Bacteroidetes bacterium]|nr:DUF3341 domain-containing protein [Bacteroidota bacterium]MBP6413345.1 DUF3341 domain-containing protein [Bacteroidia bacterium]MBK9800796.1 DUF3341 domain-containing protein [Bacteroidota bacterium]HRH02849.1 DUF3341 domain-containing protein [Bacteroidia bacterium]HRH08853.1 DUF3341 domain-containing protein [Bacteroidia bacterium]